MFLDVNIFIEKGFFFIDLYSKFIDKYMYLNKKFSYFEFIKKFILFGLGICVCWICLIDEGYFK